MRTDSTNPDDELHKLRQEHRQISDLLALVQEVTGQAIQADSMSDLFARSFGKLHHCIDFDVAAAVMLEQNLDLYLSMRSDAQHLVGDPLVDQIRATLQTLITVSFTSTEILVRSEHPDLPGQVAGTSLAYETHALLKQENRIAGLLLLYRTGSPFTEDEHQILEIFAVQVSMLLGNLHAREQILNLADTDDLTGIWNKRYFRRALPQEIERARVYSLPLSLLMIDIDEFKQINDSFGHTVGDVVLSELCGSVREMLRPPDLFARFGGDELAIILPHTDLEGARAVAERILQRVATLIIPTDEEGAIRCSISIGVADFQADDVLATDLIRRADERLYAAKRTGKNRYVAE